MSTIEQQIEALEFEREGYVTFKKKDRVRDVDEQLEYWRGQLEKHGPNADAETLTKLQSKQAIGGGVITEAEAARENPAKDGEEISNKRAAAHAGQTFEAADTPVVTEAEVAVTDSAEKVEERSNALAAQLASEPQPNPAETNVVTEAEVVAQQTGDQGPVRPGLNASSEEWRQFAAHPDISLDVPDDAGREQIVSAYVDKFVPAGNASKETWVKYARDHGIDPGDLGRDDLRAAAVEAGWAKADEPPVNPEPKPKRNTADKTPRSTR